MKKDAVRAYNELESESMNDYDYLGKSASCQDQTGLIPAAPQNAAELESYQELFPFINPPKSPNDSNSPYGSSAVMKKNTPKTNG